MDQNAQYEWNSVFIYENANLVSAWKEHLQIASAGEEQYLLRVFNPPISDEDEPNWIEWETFDPVPLQGIRQALRDWASDRGVNDEAVAAATIAIKNHLPAKDANRL
jgi:hypothetical protein